MQRTAAKLHCSGLYSPIPIGGCTAAGSVDAEQTASKFAGAENGGTDWAVAAENVFAVVVAAVVVFAVAVVFAAAAAGEAVPRQGRTARCPHCERVLVLAVPKYDWSVSAGSAPTLDIGGMGPVVVARVFEAAAAH